MEIWDYQLDGTFLVSLGFSLISFKRRVVVSNYLSVTSLTKYLKMKFDRDPYLERVYLTGRINFRRLTTSISIFLLRRMRELLFKQQFGQESSKKLGLTSKKGMKNQCCWSECKSMSPSGSIRLLSRKAEPDGVVPWLSVWTALVNNCQDLFWRRHKQTLLILSKGLGLSRVLVVQLFETSLQQLVVVFLGVEILLFPTKVQGEGAAQEIVKISKEPIKGMIWIF